MKNLLFLILVLLCVSCQYKQENTTPSIFTEEEAYAVMNTFIADQKDKPVLWNDRQLVRPSMEYTTVSFDEIPETPYYPELSFPVFTKGYWKIEKLKNTILFNSKEYDYFFANESQDEIEIEKIKQEWQTRFKDHYLYNVSYPIYNANSKVAIIAVYYYKIPLYCGTGLHQTYCYKKTTNGWSKGIPCNGCN
ncbi:hypothetical protein FIA58_005775 [Flavobacterium jejuense]|uniref:Lipoprotein n=1 Tax=Flavobacterium jejuense TaxID=1544455 RepID=A0ABX0IRR8_9FLAO|nr:hypothetical protein [Flavobacterium jejuense]NHN25183.1 hypothetical protein [Flavobacterium jejuense]